MHKFKPSLNENNLQYRNNRTIILPVAAVQSAPAGEGHGSWEALMILKSWIETMDPPKPRLRLGVRWQAERDTAFDCMASFDMDVKPESKAVSQPPHSKTLRRLGRFMA